MHNLDAKFAYQIKKNQRKADEVYNQPAGLARDAFLGDNTGVIDTYNGALLPEGYVVVRDFDGNLSIAYNQRVPLIPNIPIKVGYNPPLQPTLFQVLGMRDYLPETPAVSVPYHHKTHEFPGPDTVFVHSEQWLPGLLTCNNGFIINIYPFFFKKNDGTHGYIPYQTIDLASYKPASGAQAFIILAGDDSLISVVAGTTQISTALITLADFPQVLDPTKHELWGIRLYNGQSTITQTATYTDVYDFRAGGIGGGGIGHAIYNQNEILMPQQPRLEFLGYDISVTDDIPSQKTIVSTDLKIQHIHETTRWSGLAGQTTFDLPDFASEVSELTINGLVEDTLAYTLSDDGLQIIMTALPYDAVIASSYLAMII